MVSNVLGFGHRDIFRPTFYFNMFKLRRHCENLEGKFHTTRIITIVVFFKMHWHTILKYYFSTTICG
jgi:hypothetical protein